MKKVWTLLVAAVLLIATPVVAQATWKTPQRTNIRTAEVRLMYLEEIREIRAHRAEVRRAERRRAAREAAAEAAAAVSVPTSAPTYSSSTSIVGCLSDAEIAAYARAAGFPESVIPTMVYIAAHRNGRGESGGCPGVINPSSGACGLWQLYPCYGGSAWLDPATNAHFAYEKYRSSGLSPWGM